MFTFTRPRAELLGFDQGLFTLQTDRPITKEVFKARAYAGSTHFDARFQVVRELPGGPVLEERARALGFEQREHYYCCRLEYPPVELLPIQHEVEPLSLRQAPRVERRLRVLSPQLPQYLALAADVSTEGIGLVCSGPVEEGLELPLRIDLDEDHVEVDAQVRWCQKAGHRWHNAGARFLEMTDTARQVLHDFLNGGAGLAGAAA